MKKIVIALAMGITAISSMAATSMKFTVNGMVCSFCAQGIEKSLLKMGATKEVFVDLKKKTVAVEAKEGQVLDAKAINRSVPPSSPFKENVMPVRLKIKSASVCLTCTVSREMPFNHWSKVS